jgi:hypothetical protein
LIEYRYGWQAQPVSEDVFGEITGCAPGISGMATVVSGYGCKALGLIRSYTLYKRIDDVY